MWELSKKIKRCMLRRGQKQIELNGPQTRSFIEFWKGMYQDEQPPHLTASPNAGTPPSKDKIRQLLKGMPNRKAPGPDGITAELIRQGGQTAEQMTIKLVEHIWSTAEIPQDLNMAHICLLPKGTSDLQDPSNHRPISLMNFWIKMIDKLINK